MNCCVRLNTTFWIKPTHRFIAGFFYFPKYKNCKIICETQATFRLEKVNFSGNEPEFAFVSMKMLKEIFQNTLLADLYGLEDGEKQQKFLRRTLLNAATAAAGSGACPP